MLKHIAFIPLLLIISAYTKAGGFYVDFIYQGKEEGAFLLKAVEPEHMRFMPKGTKECKELRVKFQYSYSRYFSSLLSASKYPNIFTHRENIEKFSNTKVNEQIRLIFMAGWPFKYNGCDLRSTSLLTETPNEYYPILDNIP